MELSSWLSTVAALGALAAAVFAALTSARLLRIERERDAAAEQEHRRAGAAKVYAWLAVHFVNGERLPDGVVVVNGDAGPIFDVRVESTRRDGSKNHALRLDLLPPGEFFVAEKERFHWDFPKTRTTVRGSIRPVTKHAAWRVTEMTFTDAARNRWHRDDRGHLDPAD